MPKLTGIAIRTKKRAPMEARSSILITLESGLEGDFRGKPGNRQVTVLSHSAWRATCEELDVELDWLTRRANLLVDELLLVETAGKVIVIGEVELLVTQETDPCERMEEARKGLFDAMAKQWRGGVCCRVIKPGRVSVGDEVILRDFDV